MKTILIKNNTAGYLTNTNTEGSIKGINSIEVTGKNSLAIGENTRITGDNSLAHGLDCYTLGANSHVEGEGCQIVEGKTNHAEGKDNGTDANYSHVEGQKNYIFSGGIASHVEGYNNQIEQYNGKYNHVEGQSNSSKGGEITHIEGYYNISKDGVSSHIEGENNTIAYSVYSSHIEGYNNLLGDKYGELGFETKYSHIEGQNNICTVSGQHVEGQWNDPENTEDCLLVVGNGTDENNRSNAMTINKDGVVSANQFKTHNIPIYGTIFGSYYGNGQTQYINLGFKPKSLLINSGGGFEAQDPKPFMFFVNDDYGDFHDWTSDDIITVLSIKDDGFEVKHTDNVNININNIPYMFMATYG